MHQVPEQHGAERNDSLLRHAVHKTMLVCAALAAYKNANHLAVLTKEYETGDQAVSMILNQMLRELADTDLEPTEFDILVYDLIVLSTGYSQ